MNIAMILIVGTAFVLAVVLEVALCERRENGYV